MKLKDLVLISLLGACGAVAVLTTRIFHALIPLPGFGAIFFIPVATACLIIARGRVKHWGAAGMTKLVQQVVMLMLPGGSIMSKNPLLIPLMVVDGFLIDLAYKLWPRPLESSKFYCGLLAASAGFMGLLLQIAIFYFIIGNDHHLLARGPKFFLLVFGGLHAVLRFVGGIIGSQVLKAIPERAV